MVDQYNLLCRSHSFCPGSPYLIDTITIVFASYESAAAVSASTCSRQVTLSTNIKDKDDFTIAMKAVIHTTLFTMS